jgi:hypothetical protein
MKIAIQGLGEVPTTVLLVLQREKPEVTHIICSDYQLKFVAMLGGYDKPNEEVVKEAAEKLGVKVIFHKCDVLNPLAIEKQLKKILDKIDPRNDELIINYTGGPAPVKLLLGAMGVKLSSTMNARVIYAIKYPEGIEFVKDHTDILNDVFQRLKVTA